MLLELSGEQIANVALIAAFGIAFTVIFWRASGRVSMLILGAGLLYVAAGTVCSVIFGKEPTDVLSGWDLFSTGRMVIFGYSIALAGLFVSLRNLMKFIRSAGARGINRRS